MLLIYNNGLNITKMNTLKKLKINNVFGIKPSLNCEAAGLDFYIPNIPADVTEEQYETILTAFQKSYGLNKEQINVILDELVLQVAAQFGATYAEQELNLLHLYLATSTVDIYEAETIEDKVSEFVDNILIFDKNRTPGLELSVTDHVKFNSGIKMDIPSGMCGLFVNKSGRGTKGWDVRAQLVDPDYAGYVHCSLSFTSGIAEDSDVFCGDKLTQMIILPYVVTNEIEEISDEEYTELKSNSKRGDKGFGSSNEKH